MVEEIVCKVNGDIITRSEIEKDRRDAENEFRQQGLTGRALQEAVAASTCRICCAKRIDQLLLVQKGKELDLKVDGVVTKRMANMQRQSGLSDPEKFQTYVREHAGMPFEDYKNEIKNQLLIERVIRQEVSSTIKFKREDLEKYYNDHKDEFQRKERIFLERHLRVDRRQGRRGHRRRREKSEGSFRAREEGREILGDGADQFRRAGRGFGRRASSL